MTDKFIPPFKEINLMNEEILIQQQENIRKFKKRWLRLIIGILGMVLSMLIGMQLSNGKYIGWGIIFWFVFGIPTTFFALLYKCPKCGTMPSGTAYSFSTNSMSYTKGFHPFPQRCSCCGFYLANRALKADLKNPIVSKNISEIV